MKASVEISMYPLGRDHIPDIKDFIERIKKYPDIECKVNTMSTQLFGDYRQIMQVLTNEVGTSFDKEGKSIFVMKIINADLAE